LNDVIRAIVLQLYDHYGVAPQIVCKRRFGVTPSSRSMHWLPVVQPPLAEH
jgi:hypothetical protein